MRSRGSNEPFTTFQGELRNNLTHQPKPDFWFGLGLYDEAQLSLLKGLELKDKGIQYFTQENLATLSDIHRKGLVYRPVRSSSHTGFPWMIVVLKKEPKNKCESARLEQECTRQAACQPCLPSVIRAIGSARKQRRVTCYRFHIYRAYIKGIPCLQV